MIIKNLGKLLVVLGLISGLSVAAVGSLVVPATSCVQFAGQTQPELSSYDPVLYYDDTTVAADTLPPSVGVVGCATVSVAAAGQWNHGPSAAYVGPEGSDIPVDPSFLQYEAFGISIVDANLDTLVGVFLTDDAPDPLALPAMLDDVTTTPQLQQAFIIGAGLDNIQVPAGATRLFLGCLDGHQWINNLGAVVAFVAKDIEIDIKPGSFPSTVNLKKKGLTPVAIHTTDDFDASVVDPSTVLLNGVAPVKWELSDCAEVLDPETGEMVGDGDIDLVLFFDTQALADAGALQVGDTEATLTGMTYGGVEIEGTGDVRVINGGGASASSKAK